MRPKLLDLFCGAGGCAMGYYRAGFDVVGVDIRPQPRFPFRFVQGEAVSFLQTLLWGGSIVSGGIYRLTDFAAIHASPPCQKFSERTALAKRADHPDLVAPIRGLLEKQGRPWVIENVECAPLVNPVVLCGSTFGLRVSRHRLFESNVAMLAPSCEGHGLHYRPDNRRPNARALDQSKTFVTVTGGGNCSVAVARKAMGIDWMTKQELNQAIPPAYTEWIGKQLMRVIKGD